MTLASSTSVKRQGSNSVARCPAHEDTVQSLSISTGDDGRVLLRTTSCTPEARYIPARRFPGSGNIADLFVQRPKRDAVSAEYRYTDETGGTLFVVERRAGKKFVQKRPDGAGWAYNLNGTRRVPYRLPEVLEGIASGRWVLVVEGEKDAEALASLGFSSRPRAPGGSRSKWRASKGRRCSQGKGRGPARQR